MADIVWKPSTTASEIVRRTRSMVLSQEDKPVQGVLAANRVKISAVSQLAPNAAWKKPKDS
ncbi:hypothetical protein [Arthrobacter antibioticus]|uniref:hypothetical protein n=1 Tax=Arthrobacter sp. H35-MC1 TaxID=3046203 RepID=UPI0024B94DD0|nr:hypothetical protein [Arthrobacter sp. H35-MC1]MDJ0316864.1 hypothetical protein [Arthrobacter sp. H35-MC1]